MQKAQDNSLAGGAHVTRASAAIAQTALRSGEPPPPRRDVAQGTAAQQHYVGQQLQQALRVEEGPRGRRRGLGRGLLERRRGRAARGRDVRRRRSDAASVSHSNQGPLTNTTYLLLSSVAMTTFFNHQDRRGPTLHRTHTLPSSTPLTIILHRRGRLGRRPHGEGAGALE